MIIEIFIRRSESYKSSKCKKANRKQPNSCIHLLSLIFLFLQPYPFSKKMLSKKIVHKHFLLVIEESISRIQKVLIELKDSGANETKSTAGDKHETALAMIQIEQANMRSQLENMLQKKLIMQQLDPTIVTEEVRNGSLVFTDKNILYISVAVGKQTMAGKEIIAISPQSPMGLSLMGSVVGSSVMVNQQHFKVIQLF